jgi:N-acyl-D-amino-acid deacylase
MHDLSITNARVYDGSGAPAFDGGVAVADGRIVDVGPTVGRGREAIDAEGLALAPGIIDSHTHYDCQLTWDPYAAPSPALGVTTVITGNCGFTIAPCHPEHRDLMLRHLESVEGMSIDALRAGTRWEFETFAEYLTMLERLGTVPNVAAYCGHSAIRTWVLGAEATERAATDAEIDAMSVALREALEAGAVGVSTTTFEGHNGADGAPMPSRLADEREMRALARTLREAGKGSFLASLGSDHSVFGGRESMAFLESMAAESGRPGIASGIVHVPSMPESCFAEMDAVAAAQSRGRRVYAQVSCSAITLIFTLATPFPFEGLRTWQPAFPLYEDHAALAALYDDSDFREAVKKDLIVPGSAKLFTDQWDRMVIEEAARDEYRHLRGRDVASLAAAEGVHPFDWFLDFGIAEDFETRFSAEMLNYDEDAVERLLTHPVGHPSLSDGGAHVSMLCDAGFGLHLMGHWARERAAFPLEEAVRKLTSLPGEVYGILNRGRIEPGRQADLLLFDPATVARGPTRVVHDQPTGARRITRDGVGVHGVWVNGARIVDEAGLIEKDARPGAILRTFAA